MQFTEFLSMTLKVRVWCVVRAYKVTRPMIFEEKISNSEIVAS
jgi:hypothetical protein